MKPKRAADLTKGLIVDLDGWLAGETRPLAERHSAGASALIGMARLFDGLMVNIARISQSLEDIADKYCEEHEDERSESAGPRVRETTEPRWPDEADA